MMESRAHRCSSKGFVKARSFTLPKIRSNGKLRPPSDNTALTFVRLGPTTHKRQDESMSTSNSVFVTGGTLRHDAPSYVERQADKDIYEGLRKGEFCYVLTSRQMGKSSLMARTANRLRSEGANVIALDLTAVGQNLTPEQWYDGLIVRMGRQLRLEDELEDFWLANNRL